MGGRGGNGEPCVPDAHLRKIQQYDADALCPRVELPADFALTGQVAVSMVRLGVDSPLALLSFDLETDGLPADERRDVLMRALSVIAQPEISERLTEARKKALAEASK